MNGKYVIVTGSTSGIGLETARKVAQMGAAVTLISRDAQKLQNTTEQFKQETNNDNIDWIQADLSSIESTKKAAKTFLARHNRLDVLVNNAGAVFLKRQESIDGIEMTVALNHVGVFVLTNELLPLMKETAPETGDGRIINVSSQAHRNAKFNWDDLEGREKYGSFQAYSLSKAMNILHANALARQLEGTGITANSLHPGVVATNIWSIQKGVLGKIANFAKRFMITSEDGAQTNIYLATSADVQGITGKYWMKSKQKAAISLTDEIDMQKRLWKVSEAWIAQSSNS